MRIEPCDFWTSLKSFRAGKYTDQCVPEALSGVFKAVGGSDIEHLMVQDVCLFLFLFLQLTGQTQLFRYIQYECLCWQV